MLIAPEELSAALSAQGLTAEALDEAVMVLFQHSTVLLLPEPEEAATSLNLRLHLDLNVYVEGNALGEVLLGVNALNLTLERGYLALDLHEEEGEDGGPAYGLIGRGSFRLLGEGGQPSPGELPTLASFVASFEDELRGAVEALFLEGAEDSIQA